ALAVERGGDVQDGVGVVDEVAAVLRRDAEAGGGEVAGDEAHAGQQRAEARGVHVQLHGLVELLDAVGAVLRPRQQGDVGVGLVEEDVGDVGAEEAGRAGDEYSHATT